MNMIMMLLRRNNNNYQEVIMSGGQKINDMGGMPHTSDMAMKSKTHTKHYTSAEGAGTENEYEDTDAAIKKTQEHGVSQAKKHPLKSGYRY